jgi:hypothetical protein
VILYGVLFSWVESQKFVICLDFRGFVNYRSQSFVLCKDFVGFVNYPTQGFVICQDLWRFYKTIFLEGLYFATILEALLAICIVRISYLYNQQVFGSCELCVDLNRKYWLLWLVFNGNSIE